MNPDSSSGPGVRRLRERQRESTAQEILTAAEQVFVERGIHSAHMSDIAARAGVAVGTLYNHYKDRDALLCALAAQRRQEMLLIADECLERNKDQPFREQLTEYWRVIFSYWEKHFQFFCVFMQSENGPPAVAQPSLAIQREIYKRYEQLVEVARKQKLLRPKMAKLAPALLMGMSKSVLMTRLFISDEESPVDQIETLVDFFLAGSGGKTP